MKKFYIIIIITLFLVGCSNEKETNFMLPINEGNFVNMMAEIHLAEAGNKVLHQVKDNDFPFELEYLYASIFAKYNFTQEKLETLLLELAEHPEEMKRLFKKVETQLNEWEANGISPKVID